MTFSLSRSQFVQTLAAATVAPSGSSRTLTVVMSSPLRALDPVVTTAVITSIHALMVYDLLLAQDKNGRVQPQMASWTASRDGKTYTFRLRDGLKWHDGAPVTADDCIASIKRWSQVDPMGQVIMGLVTSIRSVNEKTFAIALSQPNDLILEALAKTSAVPAFMMPKRLAETPPHVPVKETIGSGPFRFVSVEFQPGVKAVYEKFRDYVPRKEPPSGSAGGKIVYVDRIEWVSMPDETTAVNALMSGEIDFMESVPYDLLPMLQGKASVRADVLNKLGSWTMARYNFLYPPFNNKLARQAAMYAVSQQDVLKALVGNPKFYRTCAAVFGCGTPYESHYGRDIVVPGNIAKAKQLLKQSNYDGTKVVVLHPSDNRFASSQPLVVSQALGNAGFNVDLQTMDWQTLTARRAVKKPPSEGGWSLFVTYSAIGDQSDPLRSVFVAADGDKAWFGWPNIPAIEDLRAKFAKAPTAAERKTIAEQVDKVVIDEGVIDPLGQYFYPAGWNAKVSGLLPYSRPLFWNVRKA